MKINVLMTVYNEGDFLAYSLRSCLPHINNIVIVEGAYRESIALGASPRSTDSTLNIIKMFAGDYSMYPEASKQKIHVIHANERSDPHQRNVGLEKLKKLDPNGWLLIIDGDEVYQPITFRMIAALQKKMEAAGQYAAYFKSLTFVNDLNHYCEQEFPRLFRMTPGCRFVNDNFMEWPDAGLSWSSPHVVKVPNISYFHYSFCKNHERFMLKKKWWESRFDRPFEYSWHIDDGGKIADSSHKIYEFQGKHPDIMKEHPLCKERK